MNRKIKSGRGNQRKTGICILMLLVVALFTTTIKNNQDKGNSIYSEEDAELKKRGEKTNRSNREKIEENKLLDDVRAGFMSEKVGKIENKNTGMSGKYRRWMNETEKEMKYFPLPETANNKKFKLTFENSWMMERTYGGKRGHEGCDLMVSNSETGLHPVLSMTNGIITNIGWVEKGGYRIGITSKSGTYYYYAHLHSFGNKIKGDTVMAGEVIGFMGDSGYGKEGTTGKFPVHLHIGIYKYDDGEEISVNPYYILKKCRKQRLKYYFIF